MPQPLYSSITLVSNVSSYLSFPLTYFGRYYIFIKLGIILYSALCFIMYFASISILIEHTFEELQC